MKPSSSKIKSIIRKVDYDIALAAVALVLGLYLNWPIIYVGILVFIIWMILRPIKNEILIKAALAVIVLIPISQASKDPFLTESLGIIVFILLIFIIYQYLVSMKIVKNGNKKIQKN